MAEYRQVTSEFTEREGPPSVNQLAHRQPTLLLTYVLGQDGATGITIHHSSPKGRLALARLTMGLIGATNNSQNTPREYTKLGAQGHFLGRSELLQLLTPALCKHLYLP